MKRFFLLAMAVAVATTTASAEGYQVNTLSAKQLGMGHVGVSQKLNSESLWFNPAAASLQEQTLSVAAGFTGIAATATWQSLNDYVNPVQSHVSDNDLSTPLYFNLNYKVNDRLSVGVNFNTPYGSSMNWGDSWAGAHLVQNIKLQSFNAQPTISYRITDKLSVGAGLMMSWGSFELSRSMFEVGAESNTLVSTSLGAQMAAAGAPANAIEMAQAGIMATGNSPLVSAALSGDAAMTFGVNVGLMYDICDQWSIGASYRSKMMMGVDAGHAALDYANEIAKQALSGNFAGMDTGSFSAELPMPSTFSVGASYRPTNRMELAAEFQWVHWSSYENLVVTFNEAGLEGFNQNAPKNYSNTMMVRVGGQYDFCDHFTGRLGLYVDESPVSSDYLNPETPSMTKVGYTCGFSVMPFANRNFSIDCAYAYITSADPERTGSYPYINSLYQSAAKSYGDAAAKYAAAGMASEAAAAKAAAESAASKVLDPFKGNYSTKAHTFSVGLSWGF